MKLHLIQATNINSLYGGPHSLNLDADLGGAALFLIQGPTGAGKTSLLDTVSLALFGTTPRAVSVNAASAVAERVMSRGAGTCQALVVFSTVTAGVRTFYRAVWSARRARGAAGGTVQAPVRAVERLRGSPPAGWDWARHNDWELIEGGIRQVDFDAAMRGVLGGFTSEDFERSMLLAQGRFDQLLHAKPAERASILERLTQTGSHAAIGRRVSLVKREIDVVLGAAEQRLKALALPSADALAAQADAVDAAQAAAHAARGDHEAALAAVGWAEEHGRAQAALAAAVGAVARAAADAAAAAPALARLAAHERVADLFGVRDGAAEAESEAGRAAQSAAEAAAGLPAAEEACRVAESAVAHATQRLLQGESALAELRPVAAGLREAEAAAGRAQVEAARAGEQRKRAAEAAATARAEADAIASRAAEAARAAAEAAAVAEARAVDRGLAPEVEARTAEVAALEARQAELARRAAALQRDDEGLRAATARLGLEAAALERRSNDELQPLVRELEAACADLPLPAAWDPALAESRAAAARLRAGVDGMAQVRALLDLCQAASAAWSAAEADLERLDGERSRSAAAREVARARVLETEAATRVEEARCLPLRRVAALAAERVVLRPGEDCPLCGSAEHPRMVHGDVAAVNAAVQAELDAAERALLDRRTANLAAAADLGAREAEVLGWTQRLAEQRLAVQRLRAEADARAESLDARWAAADLPATVPDARSRVLEQALAGAEAAAADASATLVSLESRVAAARRAEAAHRAARDALDAARTQHAARQSEVEGRLRAHHDAAAAHAEDAARLQVDLDRLNVAFTALGEADGALSGRAQRLRQRVAAALDALRASDDAASHAAVLRATAEGRAALAQQAEAEAEARVQPAADAEAEAGVCRAEVDAARAQLRVVLAAIAVHDLPVDAPLPPASAPVAELLDAQERRVAHLRGAQRAAEQALGDARAALASAAERARASAAARDHAVGVADALAQRLDEALRARGLEDVAGLDAVRVPAAALAELQALARAVREAAVGAAAAKEHAEAQLGASAARRPAGVDAGAGVDALREALAGARSALDSAEATAQESARVLASLRSAVAEHAALAAEVGRLEARARPWRVLYKLIGVKDGAQFQEFAQALNLGQLIRQANAHLARLEPRYEIVQKFDDGLPTLNLAIRDHWQGGEQRELRSLSGGETFLTSLALALGLSDLRTSTMPIETLLLDEGFGTLDANTLTVALRALGQLQAGGRQVGIISHVAALQEKIPAQVIIEPLGNGRSRIRASARPGALAPAR